MDFWNKAKSRYTRRSTRASPVSTALLGLHTDVSKDEAGRVKVPMHVQLVQQQPPPAWLHSFVQADDYLESCNCLTRVDKVDPKMGESHKKIYFCTKIARSDDRFKFKYCSITCAYSDLDTAAALSPISNCRDPERSRFELLRSGCHSSIAPTAAPSSKSHLPLPPIRTRSNSGRSQDPEKLTFAQRSSMTKEKHPSVFQGSISRSKSILGRSKSILGRSRSFRGHLAKYILPSGLSSKKHSSSASASSQKKILTTKLFAHDGNSNRKSSLSCSSSLELFVKEISALKLSETLGENHGGGEVSKPDDQHQNRENLKEKTTETPSCVKMSMAEMSNPKPEDIEGPELLLTKASTSDRVVSFRILAPDESRAGALSTPPISHYDASRRPMDDGECSLTMGPLTTYYSRMGEPSGLDEEIVREKWSAVRTLVLMRMAMTYAIDEPLMSSSSTDKIEFVSCFQQQTTPCALMSQEYPVYAGPGACETTTAINSNTGRIFQ
ncbi:hypothetical protein R1flu_009724 [Riccia fluitans]|uniref:Uncharacterized protein n=1 Tax=Riccia fluitans TaxID=41844 RepID=A0ABD1Z740_9MARC